MAQEKFKIKEIIGALEVKALYWPKPGSHKGDNGKLLIIGGSRKYHGAPILAARIASKIVDLVYFSSVPENNSLVKKMKAKLCEFITITPKEINRQIKEVEAVLIGPGLAVSQKTKELLGGLLKKFSGKKFILDAGALRVVDKKLLNKNCLIMPHHQEFKDLFGRPATARSVKQAAKKYGCLIVLKGQVDYLASPLKFAVNKTGNQGMTKGGTGDVLAGLIAALACKNELFLAAAAGLFLNGLAGDHLLKKTSFYYSASDLIEEIPKTIKQLL